MHVKENLHWKWRFTGYEGLVGVQFIEWETCCDQEVTNNKHDQSLQSAGGSADANEWWPFFRLHYSRDTVNNEHSVPWPLWTLCTVNTRSQRLDPDEPHLVCLFAWLLTASSLWHRLGFFQTSGFLFSNDFVSRPSFRVYYYQTLLKNWDKPNEMASLSLQPATALRRNTLDINCWKSSQSRLCTSNPIALVKAAVMTWQVANGILAHSRELKCQHKCH